MTLQTDHNPLPPQDLLQTYRVAVQQAAGANADRQIEAFRRVIDYSREAGGCQNGEDIKCNQVLFWTYNNIGDAWIRKGRRIFLSRRNRSEFQKAINSYRKALESARDRSEKGAVLQKMAQVYQLAGNKAGWLRVQEAIIAQLPEEKKSRAYYYLAKQYQGQQRGIFLLEKALDYSVREEVSVLIKCQNILAICDELKFRYRQIRDFANQQRIEELSYRTAILMLSAIEGRLEREPEKAQRMKLYEKLLAVGSRYLVRDRMWKLRTLQKMRREMKSGEVWKLNGKKYCHKVIDKKLQDI